MFLDSTTNKHKPKLPQNSRWRAIIAVVVGVHVLLLLSWSCQRQTGSDEKKPKGSKESELVPDKTILPPLREAPENFPENTYLPNIPEAQASGAIHMPTFSAGRDLTYVDDNRAWWESDHDGEDDDECDHTIHVSMEERLRRLIDEVSGKGARLKVQDSFRPTGVHNTRSLHKEGRAIDLTVDGMSLEDLAKLCWQVGFDWVYYEAPKRGGHHIHASVKRQDD